MVKITKKWIEAEQALFKENLNPETGKKEYILTTKIFPYDKTSRNGVKYNKESALSTKDGIVGITLNHNHVVDKENILPRGEWIEAYDGGDGLYGKAIVYDTPYNQDYISWLKAAKNIKVSLQVSGEAESKQDEAGKWYREANVESWLEISTVNVPGFLDAKASFEAVLCEMVQLGEEQMKENHLSVNDVSDLGGVKVKVVQVLDNGYVVEEITEEKPPEVVPVAQTEFWDKLSSIMENNNI